MKHAGMSGVAVKKRRSPGNSFRIANIAGKSSPTFKK